MTSLGTASGAIRSTSMTPHLPAGAAVRPPIPHLRRRRFNPLVAMLAVVAVLILAACTGGAAASNDVATLVDPSASPDPQASPGASEDSEAQMQAFASCMRQHGVDIQISSAGDKNGGFVTSGSAADGPKGSGGPTVAGGGKDK